MVYKKAILLLLNALASTGPLINNDPFDFKLSISKSISLTLYAT